jgi:hypothetical protein
MLIPENILQASRTRRGNDGGGGAGIAGLDDPARGVADHIVRSSDPSRSLNLVIARASAIRI